MGANMGMASLRYRPSDGDSPKWLTIKRLAIEFGAVNFVIGFDADEGRLTIEDSMPEDQKKNFTAFPMFEVGPDIYGIEA